MIEKKITVDGKEYTMRSSALIPKLYRARFGRDMVADMQGLIKAYRAAQAGEEDLSAFDLEIFERVSWMMLKHAGEDVGEDPDEWLESLDGVFAIYEILPEIIDLWNANNKTTSVPRKK